MQSVSDVYYEDVAAIAKLVFDTIYDESRSTANIETYCKKEECWLITQKKPYDLSDELREVLVSQADMQVEAVQAKKEQKEISGIADELSIFSKGSAYWETLILRGKEQGILNYGEIQMLQNAVKYCNGLYAQLSKFQIKEILRILLLLKENGIE